MRMNILGDKGIRLFVYLFLVVSFFFTLNYLYDSFRIDGFWGGYLRKVFDAMLFAFPVLLFRKKWILFSYLIIANLYLLSIIWYFRTYATIMPLSSYLMIANLKGLGPSIWHSIHAKDVVLIFPSLFFTVFYLWVYKKFNLEKRSARKGHWVIIVVSILIIGSAVSAPYFPHKQPAYEQLFHRFSAEGVCAFKKFGVIHYWIYQVAFSQKVSTEGKQFVQAFMKELSEKADFEIEDSLVSARQNLILILVESLQSWPIELKVGQELTPNINRLLQQTNTFYFPKVMSQVKDGRSSDAQLLINTGLLPLTTGAASSLCAANKFPSLAAALKEKGYSSVSFICDDATFWNQAATTTAYGFDQLYDQMQGDKQRKDGDKIFFDESLPILKKMKQPFYAQLVTISSHEPYVEPILNDSPILQESFVNDEVRNYVIAVQYVDKCIGEFIDGLKREGLYDNSVIVITGDHEQMTFNQYEGREQVCGEDYFVPFIIINSPLSSKHADKVIGQMDIYPSLLNLMGGYDYSWKGLGESVFADSISNYATFRTGIAAGGVDVPDSVRKHREECWKVSDILLRMNYFK